MNDNRNLILALVLCGLVFIVWEMFIVQPRMEQEKAAQQAAEQASGAAGTSQTAASDLPAGDDSVARLPTIDGEPAPVTGAGAQLGSRLEALQTSNRVAIESASLHGSVNLTGARFDDLTLRKYHVTVDPTSPEVVLFSPRRAPKPYFAEFGWLPAAQGALSVPTSTTVWTQEGSGKLTPETPLTLTWDNGQGLTFRKKIAIDDDYLFTVTQTVENNSGAPVTLYPYGLVSRVGKPETVSFYILHEGLIGVFEGDGLQEIDYSDLNGEPAQKFTTTEGWLGITDKYWAATLAPQNGMNFVANFSEDPRPDRETYQADFRMDPVTVQNGASASIDQRLFAGAKKVGVVDRYEDEGIYKFDLLIDWGWFYFLTKPTFIALDYLYKLVGNFGVAILILTVLIKLVFFPLANRSYEAMSRMKKLQPEMEKLRDRYKDDRMKQQQELMELYKKEKVNPLAGCWPVLIQIPVFFALYKVLFVSLEMRHAPFFGWIQDLSAPDPTTIFNLFGLIPWDPPTFLMIGVWPIIMGFTMFVQMRMNPMPADPVQQTIFTWMPLIFTFFLASFPAGLVIYWAWNNTLSVLQQGVIMRRNGVPIELFNNLGFDRLFGGRKKSESGS